LYHRSTYSFIFIAYLACLGKNLIRERDQSCCFFYGK